MGPFLVVFCNPLFSNFSYFRQILEHIHIQDFILGLAEKAGLESEWYSKRYSQHDFNTTANGLVQQTVQIVVRFAA